MFLVGELGATINADRKPFDRTLDSVFRDGGRMMRNLGSTMTKALTLPMAAFAGASVKAFADFDSAMTQSTAIMSGVTSDVRNEMEAAARSISEELTISSTQAAESYFFLASAGLDAEQSIAALPQVAKFAQAGMFDMALATDLATDAQSALGLTVDDASQNLQNLTRVTDVLVKANTLANATVEQFSQALTREAGAAMKSFNIDIEEGVAVLAAYADQGVKAELAGRGLSRIIRLVTKAANNNADAMNEMGIRVFDSEGKMRNLGAIIKDLEGAFEGLSDQERVAALESIGFEARMQGMILPLIGTSDAIKQYESELRNAGGTTDEVADKQLKSLSSQFTLLKNSIVNGAQAIGESLVETFDIGGLVQDFRTWIQDSIGWFNSLSDETRRMAFTIAGLLGASGPVLVALGTLSMALGAISAPIAGAVAAVAAGATLLISNWSEVEEYFTSGGGVEMWTKLKDTAQSVFSSMQSIVDDSIDIITNLWDTFGDDIVEGIEGSLTLVLEVFEFTFGRIERMMSSFNGTVDTELNIFEDHWLTTLDKISGKIDQFFLNQGKKLLQTFGVLDTEYDRLRKEFEKRGLEFDVGFFVSEDDLEYMRNFLAKVERMERNIEFEADLEVAKQQEFDNMMREIRERDVIIPAEIDLGEDLGFVSRMFEGDMPTVPIKLPKDEILKDAGDLGAALIEFVNSLDLGEKMTLPLSQGLQFANILADRFTQSFGQGMANVVVQGQKLEDTLRNIGKLLLSSTIQTGLQILLTGGLSGGGFFSRGIFGSIFRSNGGPAFAGQSYVVGENGRELFTPSTNGTVTPIRSGGMNLTASQVEGAFMKAMSRYIHAVPDAKIFEMSQRGRRSY